MSVEHPPAAPDPDEPVPPAAPVSPTPAAAAESSSTASSSWWSDAKASPNLAEPASRAAAASPPPAPAAAAGPSTPPGGAPPRVGAAGRRAAAASSPPSRDATRRRAVASPLAAFALFFVVLEAVALGALWAHPRLAPDVANRLDRAAADAGAARAEADAVSGSVADLKAGLAAQGARLDDADRTLAALSARQAVPAASAPAPAGPAASAYAPPPPSPPTAVTAADLQALTASIAAARDESRTAVASLAALERSDIASVRSTTTAAIDGFGARIGAMSTRVDQEAATGDRARVTADRAERLARLQAAEVALGDGRPLGAIPNAPPAVQVFADRSPPTLASLVLSFPDASRAALRASEPLTRGKGFFRRLWLRAQSVVTVREGNRVIVGDPAAGVLAAARERLAAGDLAGTVATLGELEGEAADAIDPWRSRAASLVDARAGLADMMAHS